MSSELLGWGAGFEFAGSAWGGEASCGLPECSSTEVGVPCSPNVASQMVAKRFCSLVSVGVAHRRCVQCEIPSGWFRRIIVYVLAGHSGVYVGKARLDRKRMCGVDPRALEHLRALLYTNVQNGTKPRYRILRRSLGSVFMLPAVWCDSEVRALATEAMLIKLESPECNVVDRVG